jgi:hypothetical protein
MPQLFDTIAAILGTTLAIVVIAGLIGGFLRRKRIENSLQPIAQEYRLLQEAVNAFERLETTGAHILGTQDTPAEVERLLKKTAKSHDPLDRLLVCFSHDPIEVRNDYLYNGMIELLRAEFWIAWIYSSEENAEFPLKLKARMSNQLPTSQEADALYNERCRFIEMTSSEQNVPINLTVLSPLCNFITETYLYFPGDRARAFCIRFDHPDSVVADKADRTCAAALARLKDTTATSVEWSAIKTKAEASAP